MARQWDSALHVEPTRPCQKLVDRNSIGWKSLDRNIALQSITSIGAGLTRTFSFGQHIARLDHTPIGSSIVVKSLRFTNDFGCIRIFSLLVLVTMSFCTISFPKFYVVPLDSYLFIYLFIWNFIDCPYYLGGCPQSLKFSTPPSSFWNSVECPRVIKICSSHPLLFLLSIFCLSSFCFFLPPFSSVLFFFSGPEFDGLVLKFFYGHFLKMYVIWH